MEVHHCFIIIEKATNCFKYLLINEIEDPTTTMEEEEEDLDSENEHK